MAQSAFNFVDNNNQRHKKTVLVIDDNSDLLASLQFALNLLGKMNVETATNGDEGLEKIMTLHPDCAVIDVKMAGLNGYQLIRAIRGDPSTSSIPLIILSALVQEKDQQIGLLSGADRYLTKPIKPQTLIAAINDTLQESSADREDRMRILANNDE